MIEREGYRFLPNMETNKCFGCGPANPGGLKMDFYSDGKTIVSWISVPDHLSGWNSLAHGGVVATIVDEVMGRAVIFLLKSLPMTKSIRIDFIKPVYVGMELRVEGRIIEKRDREALVEAIILDENGETFTRSEATFGLLSVESMNKRGALTQDFVDLFAQLSSMEII